MATKGRAAENPEWSIAYKLQLDQEQQKRRVMARKASPVRRPRHTPTPTTASRPSRSSQPKSRARTLRGKLTPMQGRLVNSPLTRVRRKAPQLPLGYHVAACSMGALLTSQDTSGAIEWSYAVSTA